MEVLPNCVPAGLGRNTFLQNMKVKGIAYQNLCFVWYKYVIDPIAQLVQHLVNLPSRCHYCNALPGKIKMTFSKLPCRQYSGCKLGSTNGMHSWDKWKTGLE